MIPLLFVAACEVGVAADGAGTTVARGAPVESAERPDAGAPCGYAIEPAVFDFANDAATPRPGAAQNRALARYAIDDMRARAGPRPRVVLIGHASLCEEDPVGLSEARAEAVASLLVEQGLPAEDIVATLGMGNGFGICGHCGPPRPHAANIVDALSLHRGCHRRYDWRVHVVYEVCGANPGPGALMTLENLRERVAESQARSLPGDRMTPNPAHPALQTSED